MAAASSGTSKSTTLPTRHGRMRSYAVKPAAMSQQLLCNPSVRCWRAATASCAMHGLTPMFRRQPFGLHSRNLQRRQAMNQADNTALGQGVGHTNTHIAPHQQDSDAVRMTASAQSLQSPHAVDRLMSVNAGEDTAMLHHEDDYKPWWTSHQQVLQIFGSSFWAACLLAGGFYWISWAVRSSRSQSSTSSSTAANEGHGDSSSEADSTIRASSGSSSSDSSSGSKAITDTLDDPFAPIKYIFRNSFGSSQTQAAAPSQALQENTGTERKQAGLVLQQQQPGQGTSVAVGTQGSAQGLASGAAPGRAAVATSGGGAGSGSRSALGNTHNNTATAGGAGSAPAWKLSDRWWADLAKVHYINFGAKLGILPFVEVGTMQESRTALAASRRLLVAFADKVDAEYVASSIRRGMQQAQAPQVAAQQLDAAAATLGPSSSNDSAMQKQAAASALLIPRPHVVACSPSYLEDVSREQQAGLAVVPQGVLQQYYGTQLTDQGLQRLLTDIIAGHPLSVPPSRTAATVTVSGSNNAALGSGAKQNGKQSVAAVHGVSSRTATATAVQPAARKLSAKFAAADPASINGDGTERMTGTATIPRMQIGSRGIDQAALKGLAQAVQSGEYDAANTSPVDESPPVPSIFDFPGFQDPVAPSPAVADEPEAAGSGQGQAATTASASIGPDSNLQAQEPTAEVASSALEQPTSVHSNGTGHSSNNGHKSQPLQVTPQVIEPPATGRGPMVQSSTDLIQEAVFSAAGPSNSTKDAANNLGEGGEGDAASDPMLREYERFKKAFMASRESGRTQPPAPASMPPDSVQGGVTSTEQPATQARTSAAPGPDASAASQRRSQAQRVQELLDKSGPTDTALQEALKVVGMPDPETTDKLVDEWYKILQAEEAGLFTDESLSSISQSSSTGSTSPTIGTGSAAGRSSSRSGARQAVAAAAAAAAKANGHNSSKAGDMEAASSKALADMQVQLGELQQQLQQLMQAAASGTPVTEQAARLQQKMNSLMSDMAAVSSRPPVSPDTAVSTGSAARSASPEASAQAFPRTPATLQSQLRQQASPAVQGSTSVGTGWGAGWKRKPLGGNRGMLSTPPASSSPPPAATASAHTPAPAASAATASAAASRTQPSAASMQGSKDVQAKRQGEEGNSSVVVSKRVGRERPWKKERDPAERQATIKEALRFVSSSMADKDADATTQEEYDDEGNRLPPPDPTVDRIAGIDWDRVKRAGQDSSAASDTSGLSSSTGAAPRMDTGAEKWWQRRFQAVFVPNIRYEDGSVGFLQLDCSLVDGKRDMRVVTFEDRHDCMHCLTVMKQWPEYQWHELEMGMLPTNAVESEIVRAWQTQVEAGATATRPAGVVVFRRGKLAMRVGMTQEEFTQLVVFQAAAQLSLSKVGYEFDDF